MNIELLKKCRDFMMTLRDEDVNLEKWVSKQGDFRPGCGTIACAAGWLVGSKVLPGLKLAAVRLWEDSEFLIHPPWPTDKPDPISSPGYNEIIDTLADALSCAHYEANNLFAPSGDGGLDENFDFENLSGRELAIARMNCMLQQYNAEV